MERRERAPDLDTAILAALQGNQSALWTALPGLVQAFDAIKMTVSVQPTIQARIRQESGEWVWVTIPLLVDCPVVFPGGGGFSLTFPIKVGDECLVIFASRCIDSWWESGGVQIQPDLRMHDLSDGFALVGPRSQPRKLSPSVTTNGVELRSDSRSAFVKIGEDNNVTISTAAGDIAATAGGNITANASGNINATAAGSATIAAASATVTAATITLNGNVTVNGNLSWTGIGLNAGVNVGSTHVHNKNGAAAITLGPQ